MVKDTGRLKTYNDFNQVLTIIKDKLDIIGFNVLSNNPMDRLHNNTYEITVDLNLNGVKNSFLSLINPPSSNTLAGICL